MLRRLVTVLAALALLMSVGGCAALGEGPIGVEAATILERATEAQESVESMSFTMAMRGEAAGEAFSMQLDGGGYVKGDHEGDMVMRMSTTGAGMPAMRFRMVALEGRAFTNMGGSWQEVLRKARRGRRRGTGAARAAAGGARPHPLRHRRGG